MKYPLLLLCVLSLSCNQLQQEKKTEIQQPNSGTQDDILYLQNNDYPEDSYRGSRLYINNVNSKLFLINHPYQIIEPKMIGWDKQDWKPAKDTF